MNGQINRIASKLEQLRAAGWERRKHHFGVETHQFLMRPPAAETALAGFEQAHGVALPPDYRAFLGILGDGGAGPYYGLLPLSRCLEFAQDQDEESRSLAKPCRLDLRARHGAGWLGEAGGGAHDGILALADQGCSKYCGLVVSGETRGRVVNLDLEGHPPFFVRETSFLDWYERWLDEIIDDADTDYFGYCRGGSEPELLAVLRESASSEERMDAALALANKRSLSAEALPVLRGAGESESADLRIAVSAALVKAGPQAGAILASFLADAEPKVRRAAALALHRHGAKEHAVEIDRAMRRETDAEAYFSQGAVLRNWSRLEIQTLGERSNDPNPAVRRHVAYFLEGIHEAGPVLLRLVDDDDAVVRECAVRALSALGDVGALPGLEARLRKETVVLVRSQLRNAIQALSRR